MHAADGRVRGWRAPEFDRFRVDGPEDLDDLARLAVARGRIEPGVTGRYLVWPPGPGEQLWFQVDGQDRLVGFNPHFEGVGSVRAVVIEIRRDPDHPMDGSLSCWANPRDEDPESGDYPFLVDVPDLDATAPSSAGPKVVTLRIAAFARDLRCWPDDERYEVSQVEEWAQASVGGDGVKGFAAESFIPSGLFVPGASAGERVTPQALAIFTGHVMSAVLRVNAHTAQRFWHVLTRTLGGSYDVVADPTVVEGEPRAGGVVQGSFWLTGRVVTADDQPAA